MGTTVITSRAQQGEDTRRNILRLAVDVASKQGLAALTIGDLAKELGMSKSGLFAHFGSKEDLQIATIGAAEKMFGEAIVKPAYTAPPGLARLAALLQYFIRYMEESVFPGGCFFSAVAAEFDDQPGRIRDRIVVSMEKWDELIETEARNGIAAGEIDSSVDPAQLAYELKALATYANFGRRLLGDMGSFERARTAISQRVANVSTEQGKSVLLNSIT